MTIDPGGVLRDAAWLLMVSGAFLFRHTRPIEAKGVNVMQALMKADRALDRAIQRVIDAYWDWRTLRVLKRARRLIESPQSWCRGFYQETFVARNGRKKVIKRCLVCAICTAIAGEHEGLSSPRISYSEIGIRVRNRIRRSNREIMGETMAALSFYNDRHSHAEVVAVLDNAIESV